jgi:DHA1 family tetracycline resistance protein-like MFS transporter
MTRFFKTNPLLVVFATIFIDLLGVGILIPIFPLLVLPNSPEKIIPAGWTVAGGFILLGWLSAVYPIMQFIATPIIGEISDRWGRKIVLLISVTGTAVSYVLFALAVITKNIPLLFISRALDGITGGNISVAQAIISDISTPKNRARNFGLVGMAFGLGFILGPYIGGKLANPELVSWFNASTPFWFAAILCVINIIFISILLPETLKVRSKEFKLHLLKSIQNVSKAFTKPGLRNVIPSTFLFNGGFTFFTTFFAIYLFREFNFTQSNTGDYFCIHWIMDCISSRFGYWFSR